MRADKSAICAVVVTWNPDDGLGERLDRLRSQVGGVVVVDNGSEPRAIAMLVEAAARLGAHVIRNDSNRGVATGLNQGVEEARRLGFGWCLLLDQDSAPAACMVGTLVGIYNQCEQPEGIGILGSNYVYSGTRHVQFKGAGPDGERYRERRAVITSGSLLPVRVWEECGPFMSELFVDAVDLEYCFRVRGCGYRVLSSTKALMTHSLGAYKAVTVLGVRLSTSQHSPLRRYYSVRNSLVVVRRYWRREPVATLRILRGMVQDVVLILALEHMRFRKLSAVVLGVKHFLCGRLGPLDEVTCNRLV